MQQEHRRTQQQRYKIDQRQVGDQQMGCGTQRSIREDDLQQDNISENPKQHDRDQNGQLNDDVFVRNLLPDFGRVRVQGSVYLKKKKEF